MNLLSDILTTLSADLLQNKESLSQELDAAIGILRHAAAAEADMARQAESADSQYADQLAARATSLYKLAEAATSVYTDLLAGIA